MQTLEPVFPDLNVKQSENLIFLNFFFKSNILKIMKKCSKLVSTQN